MDLSGLRTVLVLISTVGFWAGNLAALLPGVHDVRQLPLGAELDDRRVVDGLAAELRLPRVHPRFARALTNCTISAYGCGRRPGAKCPWGLCPTRCTLAAMSTVTETAVINALQSIFEALNTIAEELPPATAEKVRTHARRIAQAKATIKAETF